MEEQSNQPGIFDRTISGLRRFVGIKTEESDEDFGSMRDLKSIFESIKALKDSNLDEGDDPSDLSLDSLKWYEEFAVDAYEEIVDADKNDRKVKRQILSNSVKDYYSSKIRAGTMWTFQYEAETRNDLDFWDRFPLIILLISDSDDPNSFLGMNLHYLYPKYRRLVLLSLLGYMNGDLSNTESRIMLMNLNRLRKFPNRYGRVCIRRYKYKNIKGKMLRVPPEHWMKAIYLPTYHFVGASANKVWNRIFKTMKRQGMPEAKGE
jgi:hypothetical protein